MSFLPTSRPSATATVSRPSAALAALAVAFMLAACDRKPSEPPKPAMEPSTAASSPATVAARPDGDIAALYKAVARRVAVKIAEQSKDYSSKFPTISISKTT